ncbi:MAG: phosphoenolpyruvate synthase [Oscillospiraceae bacterium]|nr:phosphoenolpyruvate synthase [Oscillospiraceae bacterium]
MYIEKLSALSCDKFNYGGKAESLDRMIKAGLPVPEGYAISAEAFENGILKSDAEKELSVLISDLSEKYTYAVRSSAVGEDGFEASFAGAYETVLDVSADDIPKAVKTAAASAAGERAAVYAAEQKTEFGQIAIVIQRFVRPEYAGVLFTSDPITASAEYMTGNYVNGVGEALVSGEDSGKSFKINAVRYSFEGDDALKPFGKKLFSYAKKLVAINKSAQDIEWAISGGRLYILQSRPITTIGRNNTDAFEINDSLSGCLLLSKTNVGEIFLRPVSPVTYSAVQVIVNTLGIPLISNVCGQPYLNISGLCSMIMSFGFSKEKAFNMISELAGGIPRGIDIPVYPFDKKAFLKNIGGLVKNTLFGKKQETDFGKDLKHRITQVGNEIIAEIKSVSSEKALAELWNKKCIPYMLQTLSAIATALSLKSLFATREKLEKICGSELADKLLSDCSETGNIESLGSLLAVDDLINGKISREEYILKYGHRHADEMELSLPYPYEDPDFPEKAVREYLASGINAYSLKKAQQQRHRDAVSEFKRKYPSKSQWLDRVLKKYSTAVYKREAVRSEALRLFCVIREYLLKAGSLTGLGEDIFMLYINEVSLLLNGNNTVTEKIPLRRSNYLRQLEMPNFPSLICGRFTYEEWQKSGAPTGFYRFGDVCSDKTADGTLKGVPGSCGQAEGRARVLSSIEEADQLQTGEILIVQAANIGWIKLFPKAAAVVTDIGAPLSHAVIVARELGIPAVVSCQCASGVFKTGDTVAVDGTLGTVTLIE